MARLRDEIDDLHQAFSDAADEAEQQRDVLRATQARLAAAEERAERAEAALATARGQTADAALTEPLPPEPIAQPHVPTFLHAPEGGRRGRRGGAGTTEVVQDAAEEGRGGAAAGIAGEAPAAGGGR